MKRNRRTADAPTTIVVLVRFPLTITYLAVALVVILLLGLHPWR